jgi:hypothetical protein
MPHQAIKLFETKGIVTTPENPNALSKKRLRLGGCTIRSGETGV